MSVGIHRQEKSHQLFCCGNDINFDKVSVIQFRKKLCFKDVCLFDLKTTQWPSTMQWPLCANKKRKNAHENKQLLLMSEANSLCWAYANSSCLFDFLLNKARHGIKKKTTNKQKKKKTKVKISIFLNMLQSCFSSKLLPLAVGKLLCSL